MLTELVKGGYRAKTDDPSTCVATSNFVLKKRTKFKLNWQWEKIRRVEIHHRTSEVEGWSLEGGGGGGGRGKERKIPSDRRKEKNRWEQKCDRRRERNWRSKLNMKTEKGSERNEYTWTKHRVSIFIHLNLIEFQILSESFKEKLVFISSSFVVRLGCVDGIMERSEVEATAWANTPWQLHTITWIKEIAWKHFDVIHFQGCFAFQFPS